MVFKEKQGGEGARVGRGRVVGGTGIHSEGSRKPSEGSEQKSNLDLDDDALKVPGTVSCT